MSQLDKQFQFINIGSGSKGNASLLLYKDTIILIDDGLSLKRIKESLVNVNKDISNIDALLITHNHTDHINGIKYLPESLTIYASKATLELPQAKLVKQGDVITIKDITVEILKTSHDAPNPIGFLFILGKEKLVYITDTGILPLATQKKIRDADYYVIESNHDYVMLLNSGRPQCLIKRIHSRHGHLSNENSAKYMSKLIGSNTKSILLAHLSEDCNRENIALNTYKKVFEDLGLSLDKIDLRCLRQHEETKL